MTAYAQDLRAPRIRSRRQSRPKRVLHFFKTAMPETMGGIEQVIHQLSARAPDRGLDVKVLTLSRSTNEPVVEFDGYTVHRAKANLEVASTAVSISVLRRFSELSAWADLIHYHFPWPYMDLVHMVTRIRKPTVVTYHSDIVRQKFLLPLYRPLMTRFLRAADAIVATSPNYLSTSDVLQRFENKVRIIPIGLDRATYPVAPESRIRFWQERFGRKFFLFVGVMRYYKGLHLLIEACRHVPYPVVIVGAGPIERELRQRVFELGVTNVHFVGPVSEEDKVALLTSAYSVVFPSHLRAEAFGISLLEGAMFAKPLISTEIGTGTSFVNVAGETGLVVPPGNPLALQWAMKDLWENEQKAANMGRRAQARYRDHFTAARMNESYGELYDGLLRDSRIGRFH